MKTILKKDKIFEVVLGKQVIENNTNYRRINFLEFVVKNNTYIVYNLFTCELAEISEQEYNILNGSDSPYCKELDFLIENWFLVPVSTDEIELYKNLIALAKSFDRNNYINRYTIMTTTACNARCFYCYEKGMNFIDMDEKTAIDTADFIMKKSFGHEVKITWFGGEPLYNSCIIDIISKRLKENGIVFSSNIVTNGYLFDTDNINKAIKIWNLRSAQITIDGTEEIYNRSKNFIYENVNAFEMVCNNIGNLISSGIKVKIRINLGLHNLDDTKHLIEYLNKRYSDKKNLFAYITLLYDYEGKLKSDEKALLTNSLLELENKISEYGMGINNLRNTQQLKLYNCMADNIHTTLITPTGKLGMCEHYAFDDLWSDIYSEDKNIEVIDSWNEPHPILDECRDCNLLPNCISPKKCPNWKNLCDVSDRKLKKHRLQSDMYKEYSKYYKSIQNEVKK